MNLSPNVTPVTDKPPQIAEDAISKRRYVSIEGCRMTVSYSNRETKPADWQRVDRVARGQLADKLFRILMETMPAGAFVWDGQSAIFVNDSAERITGYTKEELAAMSPWDLLHPDSLAYALQQYQQDLDKGWVPRQHELKIVTKSGEPRWVLLSFDWLHLNDRDSLMVGTAIDITDRKLSEEALKESEARFRIFYQDNPAMYFTVDPAGIVKDVNQFGASQLGYEPEELVGAPVLEVFHPEDRRAVREQLNKALLTTEEPAAWEFRKVRKDGSIIWVREIARATQDVNGDPIILIVCEDVTELRRIEETLRHTREELERKVERTLNGKGAYGLTFRELTVLHLVASGKPDKEIAMILGISPLTANKHVTNILSKMEASSRAEASARAVRERILD
jgi:PAS domain S-box-containing protein